MSPLGGHLWVYLELGFWVMALAAPVVLGAFGLLRLVKVQVAVVVGLEVQELAVAG
ncbi:MAG: hypothetical protein KC433_27255 [Anaerolineales bacterium]|nr:hypothetical protein [Anaerolineales bacterium]MCB8937562.1 hypothetical protein [Ardenticatenaceae bacterium]